MDTIVHYQIHSCMVGMEGVPTGREHSPMSPWRSCLSCKELPCLRLYHFPEQATTSDWSVREHKDLVISAPLGRAQKAYPSFRATCGVAHSCLLACITIGHLLLSTPTQKYWSQGHSLANFLHLIVCSPGTHVQHQDCTRLQVEMLAFNAGSVGLPWWLRH